MNELKLGKRPPPPDARDARFETFRSALAASGNLPNVPATFGERDDEAWAYVSAEQFKSVTGKDYEGYDEAQLEEYLAKVAQSPSS